MKQTPAEIWVSLREDMRSDYSVWAELHRLLDAIEPFIYNTPMKEAISGSVDEELWRVVSSEVERRNEKRR